MFKHSKVILVLFVVLLAGCSSEMKHSDQIKEALSVMKASAENLGVPSKTDDVLIFGTTKMNENFEIVDSLTAKFGCTATFFLKEGDDFVRIATDIIQEDHRALGTILDPNGPVIVQIRKGKPFYGVVDILGNKYETGYEPIVDADGEIIGVYYVGYQISNK